MSVFDEIEKSIKSFIEVVDDNTIAIGGVKFKVESDCRDTTTKELKPVVFLPDHLNKYVVCNYVDDEYWYYASFDEVERACNVATHVSNGIVFEREDVCPSDNDGRVETVDVSPRK